MCMILVHFGRTHVELDKLKPRPVALLVPRVYHLVDNRYMTRETRERLRSGSKVYKQLWHSIFIMVEYTIQVNEKFFELKRDI